MPSPVIWVNRRDVIVGVGGFVALAIGGRNTVAAISPKSAALPAIIFDERYEASLRFARDWQQRGANRFVSQDDVVRLWRNSLQEYRSIRGLTTHSDAEVLRACAAERRLTVREWHAEYDAHQRVALVRWTLG